MTGRSEFREIRHERRQRRRQSVAWFFIVLGVILALGLLQGCRKPVDLDPRDEVVVEEQECRGASVYLNAQNQSSYSIRIHLISRSGSGWPLQPPIDGFQNVTYEVSRHFLDGGGYIRLEITGGGLVTVPPRLIPISPLSCDTGTLFITPSPSMSSYVGVDF